MSWDFNDIVDVVTAIGTLGAMAVALWLGLDAKLKERRDQKNRANLCAAAITAKLEHSLHLAEDGMGECVFRNLDLDAAEARYLSSKNVRRIIERGYFKPEIETLMGLTVLDNNCANRIAKAFDILDVIKGQADRIPLGEFQRNGNPYGYSEMLLEQWGMMFVTVQDLLRVALRECEKVSKTAAPHPTGQEVFGEDVEV